MNKPLLVVASVLLVATGSLAIWSGYRFYNRPPESTAPAVPAGVGKQVQDFALTERSGRELSTTQLAGRPYVVSFFFAHCTGFCLAQNERVSQLEQEFGSQGVRFVSISVDPERDTPAVLRDYAERFEAGPDSWLFLTGTRKQIERIGEEIFHVGVQANTHTDRLILVDEQGAVLGHYHSTQPADVEALREKLRDLIEERGPWEVAPVSSASVAPAAPTSGAFQPGACCEVEGPKSSDRDAPAAKPES